MLPERFCREEVPDAVRRRKRLCNADDPRGFAGSVFHPLVEAITSWDYKDGGWLKAPSGFIRKDHSRKPAYDMLKRLVRQEWWTDTTVKTDENGWAQARMFKGDYRIRCLNASANVSVMDDT